MSYPTLRRLAPLPLALLLSCAVAPPPPPLAPLPALPAGVAPFAQTTNPPEPVRSPKPTGAPFYTPEAPEYPYYAGKSRQGLLAEAQGISAALDSYIKAWLAGKAPARIPTQFLPNGYDYNTYRSFTLVKPEELTLEETWAVRKPRPVERAGVMAMHQDPNVTYLLAPLYAPFGHKMIIEGEFPYARFFDIQPTPSLWPDNYRVNHVYGLPEVPLVDADINPEPGSVNPFRVGANRLAANRKYRAEFLLAAGDPTQLEPAYRPPHYRAPGNRRTAGGIQYQGPYGASKNGGGNGRGIWDLGDVWIRYYRPDLSQDWRAGVPLPKLYYELPDGRRYAIRVEQADFQALADKLFTPPATKLGDPDPARLGAAAGWGKEYGIYRSVLEGIASFSMNNEAGKKMVRDLDRGIASRDLDLPGAPSYEPSATAVPYINYFVRGMSCAQGKVVVLTGKLPTFPRTRDGLATMPSAQMRYWSLVGYAVPTLGETIKIGLGNTEGMGAPLHAVLDEDLVLNAQREYVIVLSQPQDRPANATAANGITWVDWGARGEVSWTLRWLSVAPEWAFAQTPDERRLPVRQTDWASPQYDPALIGQNNRRGTLGEYHLPWIHYLPKADFEALGNHAITPDEVPQWVK